MSLKEGGLVLIWKVLHILHVAPSLHGESMVTSIKIEVPENRGPVQVHRQEYVVNTIPRSIGCFFRFEWL